MGLNNLKNCINLRKYAALKIRIQKITFGEANFFGSRAWAPMANSDWQILNFLEWNVRVMLVTFKKQLFKNWTKNFTRLAL